MAFWEHFMERPLPFLGFSKMWPVLVWLRVSITWSVAVAPLGSTARCDEDGLHGIMER